MEDIFSFADELGPSKAIYVYEPSVSLKAGLVVDNVAMGLRRWSLFSSAPKFV